MGQGDVLRILKQRNKPLTVKEIAELLNQGKRSVRAVIKKLRENGDIKKIKVNNKQKYTITKIKTS